MSTMREEVYSRLHPVFEELVDIACDHIESLDHKDIPEVLLVEDFDDELFINGKSVCCHENLYPYDVLKALDDYRIINFRSKE
jgi:hypothetical protein